MHTQTKKETSKQMKNHPMIPSTYLANIQTNRKNKNPRNRGGLGVEEWKKKFQEEEEDKGQEC